MDNIIKYLQKKDYVLFAYLFGSRARGNIHKVSDIDIALYCTKERVDYDDYLQMIADLTNLTGKPIDIVHLNTAPPLLCYQVIQEGKLLFTRSNESLTQFIIKTLFMYEDMRKYLDLSYAAMIRQTKKELKDGLKRSR